MSGAMNLPKVNVFQKRHENCEHFRGASPDGKCPAYCQAHPPAFVAIPGFGEKPPSVQCVYPSISDPEGRACGEWKREPRNS